MPNILMNLSKKGIGETWKHSNSSNFITHDSISSKSYFLNTVSYLSLNRLIMRLIEGLLGSSSLAAKITLLKASVIKQGASRRRTASLAKKRSAMLIARKSVLNLYYLRMHKSSIIKIICSRVYSSIPKVFPLSAT